MNRVNLEWFHYWMIQCLWMNDSVTHSRLTRFITGWISVFEWISWMNDSMTHSRLTRFINGWISVFKWMIQRLTQDWLVSLLDESVFLSEWFNDSLKIDSFITGWISVFEWISWMNDSMTHSRLTRFINGWISVFKWMIQRLTQDWLVSLLDESVFLNESLEWMIQWLTQDWLNSLMDESVFLSEWFNDSLKIDSFHYWMNQCFWMNLLNEWNTDSSSNETSQSWVSRWIIH